MQQACGPEGHTAQDSSPAQVQNEADEPQNTTPSAGQEGAAKARDTAAPASDGEDAVMIDSDEEGQEAEDLFREGHAKAPARKVCRVACINAQCCL
jgi:hypothetical protein